MHELSLTPAFVLKKRKLLGKDYSVTLFTEFFGKVSCMAKGVRTLTSRRAAHLQTANLIKVQLSNYHGVLYISKTDLVSGFVRVRSQSKSHVVYPFLFILEKLLPDGQEEKEIFTITRNFITKLSSSNSDIPGCFRSHLQRLLSVLGYVDSELPLNELLEVAEKNIEEKIPVMI